MTLTQSEIESQLANLEERVSKLEQPVAPETTTVDTPGGVENVVNPGESLDRTETNPELDPHQPGVEPEAAPEGAVPDGAPSTDAGDQVDGQAQTPEPAPAPTPAAEVSEKPLYVYVGDDPAWTVPEGYTFTGLVTPDGRVLYHFAGDTAGEPHTGGVDGELGVYADEVVPATGTEGQAS